MNQIDEGKKINFSQSKSNIDDSGLVDGQVYQGNDDDIEVAIEEQEEVAEEISKRDGMAESDIWAYSVGHFNNDLCASMWFIYLSYYLLNVVKLSP